MTVRFERKKNAIARSWRTCAAAFASALFISLPSFAAESGSAVVPGGGTVSYVNASYIDHVGDELLIVFTNSAVSGSFTLPGTTSARILAVGGGGGGGGAVRRATSDTSKYGGGGGGGAGGFVETNGLFGAATYTINVGAGGGGGLSSMTKASVTAGSDGGNTSIYKGGDELITAKGGGGGAHGNDDVGNSGGSGGGGSQYSSDGTAYEPRDGGTGTAGQGNKGGNGDAALYGGGGGGAGAPGKNASEGGAGGDGLTSDITGTSLYYAGGGGGGYCRSGKTGTNIPGGNGGGGSGGYSASQAGDADFYGGGGGGGSYFNGKAGSGMSGVVIVRVAASVTGGLVKPSNVNFTFDGASHTAIEPNAFYKSITGDNTATAVGVYWATVTLADDVKWADDTDDPVTVTMTISPAGSVSGTEYVTEAPIQFAGASQVTRVGYDELLLRFDGAGSFTLPGSSSVRILAVGGGGGGGGAVRRATSDTSKYGGGGGGGAGGFVETNGLFGAATYTINVGAGGGGGLSSMTKASVTAGSDGGNTSIYKGGDELITAKGGGGGAHGNDDVGNSGGSGGGGSQYSSDGTAYEPRDGGTGTAGQGNKGGNGDAALYGGGGGGAGAPGKNASEGGAGGDGLTSDITGTSLYYAGGGGGGYCRSGKTGTNIPGGNGGGGSGGYSASQAGDADFYGGGGGGGSHFNGRAGSGTNGVVYVRISTAMEGEFVKPFDISLEYDRNVHTSYVSNVFYDVVGQSTGTTAGVYVVTATLKGGGLWPDSDDGDPVTVSMTIKPRNVTFSDLTISGWEYGSAPSVPTCSVSPAWVEPIYEYAASQEAEDWSATPPEAVGTYWVRVRAPNDGNYSYEPKFAQFAISKVHVTFSNLKQRDWMFGTPDDDTPKPTCTVIPSWVEPKYEYEDDDGNWGDKKPTTIGPHLVRVGPPDFENYEFDGYAPAAFKIVKGLGNLYTDYVEISVSYTAGAGDPAILTDYPFEVTLGESAPPGFLYSRAGDTGNDLAFTDEDGDNIYQYYVWQWQTNGVSTIYVKMPTIVSGETRTIRLYWHLRPDAAAPAHAPGSAWIAGIEDARAAVSAQPVQAIISPVSRDGFFVNYWVKYPAMSKTVWDSTDTVTGVITQEAELAFGDVLKVITNIVTGTGYNVLPTNVGGSYRVIYTPKDPDGYEPISCHIDFAILGHNPYDGLGAEGEELTRSGRVLLVNDDNADGHSVSGQAYWRERTVDCGGGVILTNDLYWIHGGEDFEEWSDMDNRLPGTSHRLVGLDSDGSTNVIWRLENIILGNQLRNNVTHGFNANLCTLPWSSTALDGTSYATRSNPMTDVTSSYMMMRNKKGPCIFSPCYTNGIGTIYFDVLNGFRQSNSFLPEYYRIVVEVSTETDDGKAPTDENAVKSEGPGVDAELGNLKWTVADMEPLLRDGGATSFTALPVTNDLALGVTTAQSTNNFYRVCVRVNKQGFARFRIRRVSFNEAGTRGIDGGDLILVDNIVVSPAPDTVELSPYGVCDSSRRGNITLGQAAAMSVPFPAVTDSEVFPRAKATVYSNGVSGIDPATFASLARIHYQWHYLDQATNGWMTADLSPSDAFTSQVPMTIPPESGDVRWWYETFVQTPYYSYFDYSGTGAGLLGSGGKLLYSEEVNSVTNDNGGAGWYFRLRQGKSNWESFKIFVKRTPSGGEEQPEEPVDMEVVGDHLWRGYVRTPDAAETLQVRFEGQNLQTPGDAEYATNRTLFSLADSVVKLPHASVLADLGEKRWISVTNNAATGYLMFQIDDGTYGISIVHADYQNFNGWNDAAKDVFVGTAWFTNDLASGVSSSAKEYSGDLSRWPASNAENPGFWTEKFLDDYVRYEPFSSAVSPNGFTVGPGQWVYGYARDSSTGMALQMEGKGVGFIQFVNAKEAPRGLESIRFNARLAQAIEFDDFSYYDGDAKLGMTNYTFMTKAAYDINRRNDFSGNGSLSLVAFYQPGEGCYEFRVEQADANMISGQWQGPGGKHRLSLHRWRYDDISGEVLDEEIGSAEVDGGTGNTSMLTTMGESGQFSLLFITVQNQAEADKTLVSAGVTKTLYEAGSPTAGSSVQNLSSRILRFVDKTSKRLTYGTYGVLAANCPGRFVHPEFTSPAAAPLPTKDGYVAPTKDENFSYPSTTSGTTKSCHDDIKQDGMWVVRQRRAAKYEKSKTYFGFTVPEIVQPLIVYTAPLGSTDWTPHTTNYVSSYNYGASPIELKLWTLDDCAVKIAPGGNRKTARNDIVIDDIELRQWRGESYSNYSDEDFPEIRYGSPSNFVFTQAWNTTNEWGTYCSRLSARRSDLSVPTSIRSPLMDGLDGRGIGLGMVSYTYENAQTNAVVLVQIATNDVSRSDLYDLTRRTADEKEWTTVATNYFTNVVERLSGTRSVYLGLHGVKGVVRIVLQTNCVVAVKGSTDPEAFGEIDITGILVRDEPDIDETSWWGWNVRTVDADDMAYIGDRSGGPLYNGLSFALNNSITADIRKEDVASYPKHLPFLQTPTFQDAEVGEVRFLARKYSTTDAPTRVVLFGADSGSVAEDSKWRMLWAFDINSDRYAAYSYKVPPGQGYNAFRLAVTGVVGVEQPTMPDPDAPTSPLRVLIDEVAVFEAVRSRIAFRNVAAFRSHLDTNRAISDIMSSAEQPLCGEQFGVQCEIYASQLAKEIDDISKARVRLWWYESDEPWGFDNWKNKTTSQNGGPVVHSAWLKPCEGTNLVFRSSHPAAPDAVIDPQTLPGTVQYMLEAVYETNGEPITNRLEKSDWETPSWYYPVDRNAERSAEGFSPYTLLDTIAPGYAWINEVNVNDMVDLYDSSNFTNQYVEIAIPAEASIYNWSLRFITGGLGDDEPYYTNVVAVFDGESAPYTKSKNGSANYVFPTVGNPVSVSKATKAAGTIDAAWKVGDDFSSDQPQLTSAGIIDPGYPIGVQLVRASGIIEQSLVVAGTNVYADIPYYAEIFSATNFTAKLRKVDQRWFLTGEDTGGDRTLSLSATNQFAAEGTWVHLTKTPGRINLGQYIDPDHPTPNGSSIVLFANLEGGHLNQTTGIYDETTQNLVLYVPKGSESGTDIVYRVDHWYELDSITVNGVEQPGYAGRGADGSPIVFTAAVNASNTITVVAKARIEKGLREDYGLGDDNAYTEAVMQWLSGGATLRDGGTPFKDPLGSIYLAEVLHLNGAPYDPPSLSLTEMYWLDMDPTCSNQVLVADWSAAPTPHVVNVGGIEYTNRLMSIYMMISNKTDTSFIPYAPYTLRGVEPGSSSAADSSGWNSETFKITGYLNNGKDATKPEDTIWLPLRYYVFDENSFMPRGHVNPSTLKCDEFQSHIQIEDPFQPPSPGFYQGWWKYPTCDVWFLWNIDSRLKPVGPQVLKAQDY